MKNLQTQITALLFTLTFFFTHASRHASSEYNIDLKRDSGRDYEVSGLIPFPRVGRSSVSSALQMDKFYESQRDIGSHNKREGLIVFPRIGKRRSDSRNSALWFGPRLGRSAVVVPDNYDTSYLDADTRSPSFIKTLFDMKSKNIGDDEDNLM